MGIEIGVSKRWGQMKIEQSGNKSTAYSSLVDTCIHDYSRAPPSWETLSVIFILAAKRRAGEGAHIRFIHDEIISKTNKFCSVLGRHGTSYFEY